jgi:transposase
MFSELGISNEDWQRTPQAVQMVVFSLQHQLRLCQIRHTGYEQQLAVLNEKVTQINDLKAELIELREKVNQTSRNSSKPPSSDPPYQKPPPPNAPSGRKQGAQLGHPGAGRKLKPTEEVDTVLELRPVSCRACGHRLEGDDPHPNRQQVAEVPVARAQVTEYRQHTLRCPACGTANRAARPADNVSSSSFGARAQAIIGYLTGRLHASHRDVAEAMRVLHGLDVSVGSVAAIQQRVSEALAEPFRGARHFAAQQKLQHVDETGWRERGQRNWLWVNATREVTVFQLLGGRSSKQAQQVINSSTKGIITTDRYGVYNWLGATRRQICWAHLARDFQAMVERGGESTQIGQALLEHSQDLFTLWHRVRDATLSREQFQAQMKPLRLQVKELLEAGSRLGQVKTRRACQNILKVEKSLWTFVRVEGVEPTNNAAERALRRAVLWRRKSFGAQSETGSRFVERILTVITTLRQQGRDVLGYLSAACASATHDGTSICLLPDSS